MAIRVARNAAGNCVVFYGQTNPVYFNACLTAIVDGDTVSVRNDIASVVDENGGSDTYEFYQIPYTEFRDADNASFESAQEAADYINGIGNVTDVPTSGQSFAPGETINFYRDETQTSVLFSNGDHHGVNSIKATVKDNGRVGILTVNADVELYEYDYNDMLIDGASAGGNAQTVVNNLNALFTVSVAPPPVPTPVYLTEDGVDVAWNSSETFDPAGDDLFGAQSSSYHGARVWTTETINEPGEFFEFTFKNTVSGGGALIGIGLYDAGSESNDLSEILNDNLSNSGHHGFWFSNWFYNYSGYTAPWTTYGSNSGLVYGPGWNGAANKQFRYSEVHDQMRDLGGDVRMKCGITDDGFVGIWYFDAELANYGDPNTNRSSEWILCARSGTPVPEGQYGLLVKLASTSARITSLPRRFASDPAAPTLYYRYIESPDGNFQFPLFASEEEANYVDLQNGGTGTSHTHVYADDITATTWYMPDTGGTMNGIAEPVEIGVTYTEIPSLTNADQTPPAFSGLDLTVNEGDSVNYQTQPQDTAYTTTFSGLPAGLIDASGGMIQGSAPEVTGDNVANPSDTYTVTVTRTNSYGSSTGTFDIIVNNLTLPVVTPISGFTHVAGSTPLVDSDTLADGSVVALDDLIQSGNRLHIDSTFLTSNVLPALVTSDAGDPTDSTVEKFFVGIPMDNADFSDGISEADFLLGVMYQRNGTSSIRSRTISNGVFRNSMGMGATSTLTWEAVIQNYGTEIELGIANASANPENSLSATDGGTWSSAYQWYPVTDQSRQVVMGIVNTTMDISTAGLNEISNPVPSTNDTNWNKALDFSGNAERAQPVNSSPSYTPLKMGGSANQVSEPASGQTVSSGHPWATACVFKIDGNNSNQHIWNLGEGSGSDDDNIYLRVDASQRLFFGWGRGSDVNECYIHTLSSAWWYGIYVGFNGARYGAAGSTVGRLNNIFDIKLMSSIDSFGSMSELTDLQSGWTHGASSTNARMDREFNGYMTIGGRGSNRNFHGKVASFVSTTLPVGSAMPGDAEIEEMITDPKGWLYDYKAGNPYRRSGDTTNQSNFVVGSLNATAATQIWLMGDGIQDSYSNMIRNQVWSGDQNYTKLNLLSMQSNDIQNVTIPGLSG